ESTQAIERAYRSDARLRNRAVTSTRSRLPINSPLTGSAAVASVYDPQPITEPTNRLDQLGIGAELRAQTLHVHVDGPRLHIGSGLPHILEQLRAALHAPTTHRER